MKSLGVLLYAFVFFALGVLTSSYSLPGLAKAHSYLIVLQPALASYISLKLLQVILSFLSFSLSSLLLTSHPSRKPLALVLPTQLCVLLHIALLGNWLLPGLTETERLEALMVSYKGLGLTGGLLLS